MASVRKYVENLNAESRYLNSKIKEISYEQWTTLISISMFTLLVIVQQIPFALPNVCLSSVYRLYVFICLFYTS